MTIIDRQQITGLILAGGRGTRMGQVDKGLQAFRGMPMAMHILILLSMAMLKISHPITTNIQAVLSCFQTGRKMKTFSGRESEFLP